MKTKLTFCALALLATMIAAEASAEARGYSSHRTTVQKLSQTAEVIVKAELDRVENIQLGEEGIDAAKHKRIGDGSWQDGEANIRREAVLTVNGVLKGDAEVGAELRFVSIRQLKLDAYDADLRNGEALYFLGRRQDGHLVAIEDERGTVSAGESGGDLSTTVDFVKTHIAEGSASQAGIERMLDAVKLDGSRLSVDCALELAWFHQDYAPHMNEAQRQRLLSLCKLSPKGSIERAQLITCVGRHQPEGALQGLMEVMLNDDSWTTTSLASMSLEYVNRGQAIQALLSEWALADDDKTRMIIVRSLGLIRPKSDHDGEQLRQQTLDLVKGLLDADTDADLLREALIASRDLRSEDAHVEQLKELIDNRETNGLGDAEVKAAVIALAAARKKWETSNGPDAVAVLEREYLENLAESDPLLKQVVDAALKFPYTTLILGADGLGH